MQTRSSIVCICGTLFTKNSYQHKYCSIACKSSTTRYREATNRCRNKKQDLITKLKLDRGCDICGYKESPVALDWDHIDPHTKEYSLNYYKSMSWNKINTELSKCRLLCANCHRIHTYNEGHSSIRKEKQ